MCTQNNNICLINVQNMNIKTHNISILSVVLYRYEAWSCSWKSEKMDLSLNYVIKLLVGIARDIAFRVSENKEQNVFIKYGNAIKCKLTLNFKCVICTVGNS